MKERGWGYRTKRDQLFLKAKVDNLVIRNNMINNSCIAICNYLKSNPILDLENEIVCNLNCTENIFKISEQYYKLIEDCRNVEHSLFSMEDYLRDMSCNTNNQERIINANKLLHEIKPVRESMDKLMLDISKNENYKKLAEIFEKSVAVYSAETEEYLYEIEEE